MRNVFTAEVSEAGTAPNRYSINSWLMNCVNCFKSKSYTSFLGILDPGGDKEHGSVRGLTRGSCSVANVPFSGKG